MNLKAILMENWPLKLTSLALSGFLWVVAATEEPSSRFVAVTVAVQPPAGRAAHWTPETVNVLFAGPRRELLKLAASQISLTKVLSDTVSGQRLDVELAASDVELPRGVDLRVLELQPREIAVELDPVVRRVVPVHADVRVEADSGFVLVGGIQVVPGTVTLSGSSEQLSRVDSVFTVPLRLTHAEGAIARRLAIDTDRLGALRVAPLEVTVGMDIQPSSDRIFERVPIEVPGAVARNLRLDRDSVSVQVRGATPRIDGLTADSIHVFLEAATTAGPGRAALRVIVPPGCTGTASPDSVTLTRRIRD
ncbi:MAG: CdaR family protein [Gemmatimonadales bacterium]